MLHFEVCINFPKTFKICIIQAVVYFPLICDMDDVLIILVQNNFDKFS